MEENKRCQYCGKEIPQGTEVKRTIIGRGRDPKTRKACVTREPMVFCSGTCASNEQMSREG